MVVIGSLSMVGDGGGRGGVVRALGGRWEDVGRALRGRWEGVGGVGRVFGGRWRVVRVGAGSLIYRQIKSLHCSGYLLVSFITSRRKVRFRQLNFFFKMKFKRCFNYMPELVTVDHSRRINSSLNVGIIKN